VIRGLGAKKEQTVAVGNGANDLKMMAEAGLSVAFHAYSGLDAVINFFEP